MQDDLDDLSNRAAALGEDLSGPVIAAHLTGKSRISDQKHNVLAAAMNARLAELSLPAAAPYIDRFPGARTKDSYVVVREGA